MLFSIISRMVSLAQVAQAHHHWVMVDNSWLIDVMTQNCQLVTIRGRQWLRGQAEKKQLKGSGENVAESTPQDIYLIDSDILSQCCMGQWCPSVPWHMVHLNNNDMIWYDDIYSYIYIYVCASYGHLCPLAPTLAKELCVANRFRYRVANDGLSYYCV